MLLVIDNYDSFTYNLVQFLGELGAELVVKRNDCVNVEEISHAGYDGIVVSPGPGVPQGAGVALAAIRAFAAKLPILGVCLGHQAIGEAFGGKIVRAPKPVHGKSSLIHHDDRGVFHGLPQPLEAGRYHSLVIDRASLPKELEISAESEDGIIMGVRHRWLPIEGVQFHPESVLTPHGIHLLRNFLEVCDKPQNASGREAAGSRSS